MQHDQSLNHSAPNSANPNAAIEKRREDRARRALARQGFRLCKSRRRDPRALDHGGYVICDLYTNSVVAGGSYFCLNIDDVEAWAQET